VEGILVITENRKARHDYEFLETHEAGISLLGCEVKSIRARGINLKDSYIREERGQLFLVGCQISPYKFARIEDYVKDRERKLLLHQHEIERLASLIMRKGYTLVPTKVYFKKGRCKLEFAVGRGKKLFDKRQNVKTREAQREMERALHKKR
jgi:SsrA-binding protein